MVGSTSVLVTAMVNVSDGDTVILRGGTWVNCSAMPVLIPAINIIGADNVSFDCGGDDILFHAPSLIDGDTIFMSNLFVSGSGGVVLAPVTGGSVFILDCRFQDIRGTAVSCRSVNVTRTVFSGGSNSGIISPRVATSIDGVYVHIYSSLFYNNTANFTDGQPGCLVCSYYTLVVSESFFVGNNGRVFTVIDATIINSKFSQNNGIGYPCGIAVVDQMAMSGCTIEGNVYENQVFTFTGDAVIVTDTVFRSNTLNAPGEYMLAFSSYATLTLGFCEFVDNSCAFVNVLGEVDAFNITIRNNTSPGAALFSCGGVVNISAAEFSENLGQLFALVGQLPISLVGSLFWSNTVPEMIPALIVMPTGANVTILSSFFLANEGSLLNLRGPLLLENTVVWSNSASLQGSALFNLYPMVRFVSSTFVNNSATQFLLLGGSPIVQFEATSSDFFNNEVHQSPLITAGEPSLYIQFILNYCTFHGNNNRILSATAGAGDVFALGCTFAWTQIPISQDTHSIMATVIEAAAATIVGCSFIGNAFTASPTEGMGALYIDYGYVESSTFTLNTGYSGGAITINGGPATISNCAFDSNSAIVFGGAFLINQGTQWTLHNSSFTSNRAQYGGAIATCNGAGNVSRGLFFGNSATLGGGIYLYQHTVPSQLTITESIFARNSATQHGGGVFASAQALFINTSFTENVAAVLGGAIHMDVGISGQIPITLDLTGGALVINYAGAAGGALSVWSGTASVRGSRLLANRASEMGGAVFVACGILALYDVSFEGNGVASNVSCNDTSPDGLCVSCGVPPPGYATWLSLSTCVATLGVPWSIGEDVTNASISLPSRAALALAGYCEEPTPPACAPVKVQDQHAIACRPGIGTPCVLSCATGYRLAKSSTLMACGATVPAGSCIPDARDHLSLWLGISLGGAVVVAAVFTATAFRERRACFTRRLLTTRAALPRDAHTINSVESRGEVASLLREDRATTVFRADENSDGRTFVAPSESI